MLAVIRRSTSHRERASRMLGSPNVSLRRDCAFQSRLQVWDRPHGSAVVTPRAFLVSDVYGGECKRCANERGEGEGDVCRAARKKRARMIVVMACYAGAEQE